VKVHLLGIEPASSGQSPQLREEADTKRAWTRDIVARFLAAREVAGPVDPSVARPDDELARPSDEGDGRAVIVATVSSFVAGLTAFDLEAAATYWKEQINRAPN
jgi:hypothetical protein